MWKKLITSLALFGLVLAYPPPAEAQTCPIGRTCIGGEPVETGSPANEEVPQYNSTTGQWEWATAGGGLTSFEETGSDPNTFLQPVTANTAGGFRAEGGSTSATTYGFKDDTDSGLYLAGAGDVRMVIGGGVEGRWYSEGFQAGTGSGRPLVKSISMAATDPGFTTPTDPDTGMSIHTGDMVSLIAGGEEFVRVSDPGDVASGEVLRVSGPARATAADNDEVYVPIYQDMDSGAVESVRLTTLAQDVTNLTEDSYFEVETLQAGTLTTGLIVTGTGVHAGALSSSAHLRTVTPSSTVPDIIPNNNDTNTGVGWSAADVLSLVVGGVEAMELTEDGTGITWKIPARTGAAPTGAEGDLYADSDDNNLYYHDGTSWVDLTDAGGGGGLVSFEETGSDPNTFLQPVTANTAGGLRVEGGSSTVPTISFKDDTDTGFYLSGTNTMRYATNGGTVLYSFETDGLGMRSGNTGAKLMNEDASSTNPTIVPFEADPDTGFGHTGTGDLMSIVAGGASVLQLGEELSRYWMEFPNSSDHPIITRAGMIHRYTDDELWYYDGSAWSQVTNVTGVGFSSFEETGSDPNTFLQPVTANTAGGFLAEGGTVGAPTFSFKDDTDTGLYLSADGTISVAVAGAQKWLINSTVIQGESQGARITSGTPSATTPSLMPSQVDSNTGIGRAAADQLSLIAGGEEFFQVADPGDAASGTVLTVNGPDRATAADSDAYSISFYSEFDHGGRAEAARISWSASTFGGVGTEQSLLTLYTMQSGTIGSLGVRMDASGNWESTDGTRFSILNVEPGAATPIFVPTIVDSDTGLGRSASNTLAMVAGGVDVFQAIHDGTAGLVSIATRTGAAPSGTEGYLYADSDDNKPYYYDGTNWRSMTTTGEVHLSPSGAVLDTTAPPGENATIRPSLAFQDATDELVYWTFRLPEDWLSGGTLNLQYSMASATTGNVVWAAEVMAVTPGDAADIDTDSFDTANSTTDAVPATAGYLDEITITLTNQDSMAAGDYVTVKLYRDANNASDTATGDAELRNVTFEFVQ